MKIYTTNEIAKKVKKKNRVKKIIGAIFYPIIVVILLCAIWLVIQKIQDPEATPNLLGYKVFNVVSGSMEPTIEIGDLVIVKQPEQENIKEGDIITFIEEQGIVTHRVVEVIEEDGKIKYKTKGDNNNANDTNLVEYKNIEGIFVKNIKKIGGIITSARSSTSIIVIVLVVYLVYLIASKKSDRKDARHEKRKEFEEEIEKKG